uniref:uncharacterized protein LOC109952225 isoform X2 n=1 Tax=Monopterus albus TaxID=43700 RepID=UPI0009B45A2C|nr:uncharacterized protein LOC109952225 isoform X2 [Monopterus albus]
MGKQSRGCSDTEQNNTVGSAEQKNVRTTGGKGVSVASQRKRLGERKVALLALTENIEMELLSSEEPCVLVLTQEELGGRRLHQRHPEHPLVPDFEEPQPRQQGKPKTVPPSREETEHCPLVPVFMEEIEIEMKVFPPLRVTESELVEIKSDDPSIVSPPLPNKARRLRWKRLTPPKTGLVVKDVICLPRGQLLAQLERHAVPQGEEREALAAMGMSARITIDSGWSASQMASRLAMLFQGKFVKCAGQRFSFTYLQCVQGSRVLFVPDTPEEGWTGQQVLRISGHGPLYIFSHLDYPQVEPETEKPEVNRAEFFLEASIESCQDEDLGGQIQPRVHRTMEEFPLDLGTILRLFQQENIDQGVETHIQVRRRDLLHSALKVVGRPGFCFRTTPIISFLGEETIGHEGPLREFFRLTLLELQQSSVFEGHPGRLFFTYDLTALEDRNYYKAGVLIGWSLAQGGPGPRCLHPALFQLMCGQNLSLEHLTWTDIVNTEDGIRLQQLHSCTDVKMLSPSLCDWVVNSGMPGIYSARSDEIPVIYIRLVKHYIYHRVASMISQFTEGLNSCGGLWDTIQCHWETFVPVMTSTQQKPLTLEEFKQLCTVCYSHMDCQLRAAEEATVRHWETILTLISDGQADFSFEELLAFITGADHLPAFGLSRNISLHFYSQDASMSSVRLPHASTCTLELFLPRGATRATDLLALLSRAVHEALGFAYLQAEGSL